MLKKSPIRFSILLLVSALFFQVGITQGSGFFAPPAVTVTKVFDGDTIEVMLEGRKTRVRLWGIDTPEWKQPYSNKARNYTRKTLLGRRVELDIKDRDKYKRLVAVVSLDNRNINEELVAKGLAWVHIYFCKEPICDHWYRLQQQAKSKKLGMWQDPHPVPPWVWKKNKKRQ